MRTTLCKEITQLRDASADRIGRTYNAIKDDLTTCPNPKTNQIERRERYRKKFAKAFAGNEFTALHCRMSAVFLPPQQQPEPIL